MRGSTVVDDNTRAPDPGLRLASGLVAQLSYYNLDARTFVSFADRPGRRRRVEDFMASPILVSCPQCQKQIKAPPEAQGKKIRCKGCGNTFAVQAEAAAPAQAKPKPAPDDDDGDGNPYGVTVEKETTARCPFCAGAGERRCGAVPALRLQHADAQRIETRKIYETTATDRLSWLMPGLVCVALMVVLVIADILYYLWKPDPRSSIDWLGHGGIKTWGIIASLVIMFFLGKFAVKHWSSTRSRRSNKSISRVRRSTPPTPIRHGVAAACEEGPEREGTSGNERASAGGRHGMRRALIGASASGTSPSRPTWEWSPNAASMGRRAARRRGPCTGPARSPGTTP